MANTVWYISGYKDGQFVKLLLERLRLISYLCSAAGTEYPGTGSFVP